LGIKRKWYPPKCNLPNKLGIIRMEMPGPKEFQEVWEKNLSVPRKC